MNNFIQFLPASQDLSVAYLNTYDVPLVTLSVLIAVFASLMALELSGRIVHAATTIGKIAWLMPGALALGGGVWAMHFIGMLALSLPCGISYDPIQTMVSIVPGVVASAAALWIISRTDISFAKLALGGVLMGGGIGTMHYSGMAAMRLDAVIYYSPTMFAFSISFAILLAILSLQAKFALQRQKHQFPSWAQSLAAAVFMGIAISGMHYIAMEAAYFIPVDDSLGTVPGLSPTVLAIGIGITTVMLVALTLASSILGRHLETIKALGREIREHKLADEALRASEGKFRSIYQSTKVVALITIDENDNIATWNPGAEEVFGYCADEILGQPMLGLIPPRYRDAHVSGLKRAREAGALRFNNRIIKLHGLHNGGHEFPMELSIGSWCSGGSTYFSALIRDTTKRMEAEKRILQLAYSDAFTGMPNEASFLERLHEEIAQNSQGFVASIELSGIGDIIGTFGLEASEVIIYQTGKRLTDEMPANCIAARVGPKIFRILYLTNDDDRDVLNKAVDNLFQIVRTPFDLMGANVVVNVFMGISVIDPEKSTAESILTDVEIAHHEALLSTASCVVYFNDYIRERLVRTTQIVSLLHAAIKGNDFKLFFQPQVNLKDNTIIGCEALIRWPQKSGAWISPGEFIPIAEKSGLISDITTWTIGEACRTVASWANQQGLRMRVGLNISAEDLISPDFHHNLSELVKQTQLPPELLEIEITETALMKDTAVAAKNLHILRDLGATVAIDDFGTGHSSLAYLKTFPIDRLKIDQSFIKNAPNDKVDQEIVVSIIKLAHSLGMDVIAEGAEEKAHIDMLVSLGCDEVQGYYIAKPMPADEFLEFIKTWKSQK